MNGGEDIQRIWPKVVMALMIVDMGGLRESFVSTDWWPIQRSDASFAPSFVILLGVEDEALHKYGMLLATQGNHCAGTASTNLAKCRPQFICVVNCHGQQFVAGLFSTHSHGAQAIEKEKQSRTETMARKANHRGTKYQMTRRQMMMMMMVSSKNLCLVPPEELYIPRYKH